MQIQTIASITSTSSSLMIIVKMLSINNTHQDKPKCNNRLIKESQIVVMLIKQEALQAKTNQILLDLKDVYS